MDRNSFSLLPIIEKIRIIEHEAELLTNIRWGNNITKLYLFRDFYIEEFRDAESSQLLTIQSILKSNEKERLNFYSPYFHLTGSTIALKPEKVSRMILFCLNCEYDWVPEGKEKLNDLCCPICDTRQFRFVNYHNCNKCNLTVYSYKDIPKKDKCLCNLESKY